MAVMTTDPKTWVLALAGGIIPALLWLWFWLKQEENKPEPKGVLALVFFMGILAVIFVLPIQKYIQGAIDSRNLELVLFATAEELLKYVAVLVILFRTNFIDEPIDWPIYMISAALGFAALENTLFLIKPLAAGTTTVSLLAGGLRFLGANLLHTVASGILGIALGISLHMGSFRKKLYLFMGFVFAVALHSAFNFFIIRNEGNDFLKVFAFLWVVTIIVMLLFEKVRRMSAQSGSAHQSETLRVE